MCQFKDVQKDFQGVYLRESMGDFDENIW